MIDVEDIVMMGDGDCFAIKGHPGIVECHEFFGVLWGDFDVAWDVGSPWHCWRWCGRPLRTNCASGTMGIPSRRCVKAHRRRSRTRTIPIPSGGGQGRCDDRDASALQRGTRGPS